LQHKDLLCEKVVMCNKLFNLQLNIVARQIARNTACYHWTLTFESVKEILISAIQLELFLALFVI